MKLRFLLWSIALERLFRDDPSIEFTLISETNAMLFTPDAHGSGRQLPGADAHSTQGRGISPSHPQLP